MKIWKLKLENYPSRFSVSVIRGLRHIFWPRKALHTGLSIIFAATGTGRQLIFGSVIYGLHTGGRDTLRWIDRPPEWSRWKKGCPECIPENWMSTGMIPVEKRVAGMHSVGIWSAALPFRWSWGFLTDHRNDTGEKIAIPVEKRATGFIPGKFLEVTGSLRQEVLEASLWWKILAWKGSQMLLSYVRALGYLGYLG